MQKRDKFGRYLKGKVVKKKGNKPKKVMIKKAHKRLCDNTNCVKVHKTKKGLNKGPKLSELDLYDLQDIIQAEIIFQLGNQW
jgi:hypothetical protein